MGATGSPGADPASPAKPWWPGVSVPPPNGQYSSTTPLSSQMQEAPCSLAKNGVAAQSSVNFISSVSSNHGLIFVSKYYT